jgi:hypothetical protein
MEAWTVREVLREHMALEEAGREHHRDALMMQAACGSKMAEAADRFVKAHSPWLLSAENAPSPEEAAALKVKALEELYRTNLQKKEQVSP